MSFKRVKVSLAFMFERPKAERTGGDRYTSGSVHLPPLSSSLSGTSG